MKLQQTYRAVAATLLALTASLALAGAAAARQHIEVSASHQTIAVTGHDFPADGAYFNVTACGKVSNGCLSGLYPETITAHPNQQRLASPPCLTICDKGEFYITWTQHVDPCTDSSGYKLILVTVYNENAKQVDQREATVQCPAGAQGGTAPGEDRKSPGRTEKPKP